VYDGWNLIAILNPQSSILASFMWGTDLSGSMQGAGGVGGLLAENLVGTGVQFAAYDGNGNVVALVSASNGATTANYAYGPFGELLAAYGVAAKLNEVLFSSKIYDWETGLYYYGYRYYNPSTGRWLSRDPLEELGGANLYAFCNNCGINYFDPNGQFGLDDALHILTGVTQIALAITLSSSPAGLWAAIPLATLGIDNVMEGVTGTNPGIRSAQFIAKSLSFDPRTGEQVYNALELSSDMLSLPLCGKELVVTITGKRHVLTTVKRVRMYAGRRMISGKLVDSTVNVEAEIRLEYGGSILYDFDTVRRDAEEYFFPNPDPNPGPVDPSNPG
jgi:RHS repeat-associated protein